MGKDTRRIGAISLADSGGFVTEGIIGFPVDNFLDAIVTWTLTPVENDLAFFERDSSRALNVLFTQRQETRRAAVPL